THAGVADAQELLAVWVVDCDLAYVDSLVHDRGLMNPRSREFHGQLARDLGYDFALCDRCHGAVEEALACDSCHPAGVTDCTTCHGPALVEPSGAHAAHLLPSPLADGIPCATCHPVPDRFDAPGHVFTASGDIDPPPAEVTLASDGARYDA